MDFQHCMYIAIVFLLNVVLICMGQFAPVGAINILVVGLPQMRDTVFIIIRVIFKPFVRQSTEEDEESLDLRNVLCVVPTYKEEAKEVVVTLDSLFEQEETNLVHKRVIMVCDGFFRYTDIFSSMVFIDCFQYKTYKQKLNEVKVFFATYKDNDLIVLLKSENAGKKDSLILIDNIFVDFTFVRIRHMLLKFYNLAHFNYIFHTDADCYLSPNTIRRTSRILASNPRISGATGIVLVPREYGFWSLYQGFQYYYGQLIRRLTESYWGKPTCMPGCTNMINVGHECIIEASSRYQKLPSKKYIFQIKNRLQGTDRRYTNCVLQHSKDVLIVTDSDSHCFTIPPQSFSHFRSQRKRWTSNAITGYYFLVAGSNIPWYVRVLAMVDLFRIHTSKARLFSTAVLITHIHELGLVQFIGMGIVFFIPYMFFIYHIVTFKGPKGYALFLFTGGVLSKFVSPFITVYIFLYCLFYFTDVSWGKSHGATESGQAQAAVGESPDDPSKKGEPETLV